MAYLNYQQAFPNTNAWALGVFTSAFKYAVDRLDPLPSHLQIDLQFSKVKNCSWVCRYDEASPKDLMFMNIVPQTVATMIKFLFHEMKHIEQFVHGRLTFKENRFWHQKDTKRIWFDGVTYTVSQDLLDTPDIDLVQYHELPWEKEANLFEDMTFADFRRDVDPALWTMIYIEQHNLLKEAA